MSDASYCYIEAVGPVTTRIAEAECDFNAVGRTRPDVVFGPITRYIDTVPLTAGAEFILRDYEGEPACRAIFIDRPENSRYAHFRVVPDSWLPFIDWFPAAPAVGGM